MDNLDSLKGSHNLLNMFKVVNYKRHFAKNNPTYFYPEGLLVFCAEQGAGKTLSAVQYCIKVNRMYHDCVFCTNVSIKEFPVNCYYEVKNINENLTKVYFYLIDTNEIVRIVTVYTDKGETRTEVDSIRDDIKIVVAYDGIECIKDLSNGIEGVLYLIDEIHLEFNSLESKNIPIEIMVEVSQQRKQRKHIVGTSQVYMRLAKPLREQIDTIVICKNYLSCIQFNTVINGKTAVEENGKLHADVIRKFFWFHTPKLYDSYDTYAKMRRYRREWKGTERQDIYNKNEEVRVNGLSTNR